MQKLWCDLETYSDEPITNGTHKYAEKAEVLLWAFALNDGEVYVWDLDGDELHWADAKGQWVSESLTAGSAPLALVSALRDESYEVWFQNGGMFDFVVLKHALPQYLNLVQMSRWRDTMVQAFSHALPGSLDKLGAALRLDDDQKKDKRGKQLIHLFCKPQNDVFQKKFGTHRATRHTHPAERQEFIEYAGRDIKTMRAVHKRIPQWNYRDKQIALWHADMRINNRGFKVDLDLATAAIAAVENAKSKLADSTQEITLGGVASTNQRDALLQYVLMEHGVALPDLRADTLERRLQDDSLPESVRELIKIRLVASMNSVSKYKTLLKSVSSDGRLRGGAQFRGAGRTGRYAHRLFQHGNMPRPTLPQALIDAGIGVAKSNVADLALVVGDEIVQWASSSIRSTIIADEGKTLVVADLANIEGRVAAWLAGEDWKLQAFKDYDTIIGVDTKGKVVRNGADLYILAYANSFNVPVSSVPVKGDERQIGKVQELMFQYGGGVGAWLTGAATYGIDLDKMTEQVYPTLAPWAVEEAIEFMSYMTDTSAKAHAKLMAKLERSVQAGELSDDAAAIERAGIDEKHAAKLVKIRLGLPYKTFITCDAIKRMWRRAHPKMSSYWGELEDAVRETVANPKKTITCRKVLVRRSGAWLRIQLPSGRQLTYPEIEVADDGTISYVGPNTYTRKWERVKTYGGKIFENIVQAVACDQLVECFPAIEADGFEIVFHVHDEIAAEVVTGSGLDHHRLSELMCSPLGWNDGLPLSAAGFTADRYRKD